MIVDEHVDAARAGAPRPCCAVAIAARASSPCRLQRDEHGLVLGLVVDDRLGTATFVVVVRSRPWRRR